MKRKRTMFIALVMTFSCLFAGSITAGKAGTGNEPKKSLEESLEIGSEASLEESPEKGSEASLEGNPENGSEAGLEGSPENGPEERTGIISAMNNEIDLLLKNAEIDHIDHVGDMDFHVGELCGKPVVIMKSGIGKIRAAAGAAALLNNYDISDVIFTGIAGGVGDETKVLDIVIATELVQHDYGQITNEGFEWSGGEEGAEKYIPCDSALVDLARDAAVDVLGEDHVFTGVIATGDQFIASEAYVKTLRDDFNALACEMEGSAIAVTCTEYRIPFVVIRSMSDKADGLAHESYENMGDAAADNSSRIVMKMLEIE